MNKSTLLSLALLLAPAYSQSMNGTLLRMRPADLTKDLFVRQEFCFVTGKWIDLVTDNGKLETWRWIENTQSYERTFNGARFIVHKHGKHAMNECEEKKSEQ